MSQFAIISTSHRPDSQSHRIAEYLNNTYFSSSADVIDLFAADLPMWTGATPPTPAVTDIQKKLAEADGFVFVVPEWHGMAPAGLKNLFLWCGAAQFAHKPALLVGVSASVGGAMVIAELRSSGYKNSRLLWIPEHLILRNVSDLWQGKDTESDQYLGARTAYAIDHLKTYARVLAPERAALCAGLEAYPNGMS